MYMKKSQAEKTIAEFKAEFGDMDLIDIYPYCRVIAALLREEAIQLETLEPFATTSIAEMNQAAKAVDDLGYEFSDEVYREEDK